MDRYPTIPRLLPARIALAGGFPVPGILMGNKKPAWQRVNLLACERHGDDKP